MALSNNSDWAERGEAPFSSPAFDGDVFREAFNDANTRLNEATVVGDPYAAFHHFNGQQIEPDTCAPNAIAHATEILTGRDVNPQDVIAQAQSMGIYHANPGDWGMKLDNIGPLLEAQGIPTTFRSGMDPDDGLAAYPDRGDGLNIVHDGPNTPGRIIHELYQGNPIILAVDAMPGDQQTPPNLSRGVLWDQNWTPDDAVGYRGIDPPDHAVTVKGLEVNDGRLEAVIADSGVPNGVANRVPFEQLMDACDGGGCAYIAPQFPHTFDPSKNLELPAALRDPDFGTGAAVQPEPVHQTDELEPEGKGFLSGLRDAVFGQASTGHEAPAYEPAWPAEESERAGFLSGLRDFAWGGPDQTQVAAQPVEEAHEQRQPDPEPPPTHQTDWFSNVSPWSDNNTVTHSDPPAPDSWTHESYHQDHAPAPVEHHVESYSPPLESHSYTDHGSTDHGTDHGGSDPGGHGDGGGGDS